MAISKPITRVEQYLAHISGMRVNVPEVPLTREEMYLAAWARKSGIEDTEMQGDPPLTLKDCIGEPFNGLVLYGKSTQVTTTGAQLLDIPDTERTIIGVTLRVQNSVIEMNGTATENGYAYVDIAKTPLTGTYTLSIDGAVRGALLDDKFQRLIESTGSLNGETARMLTFFVSKDVNYSLTGIKVMLNAGDTALPWEPYTGGKPSPSPDYPQEIVSAGDDGSVTVKVTGRNILDMRNSKESVANSGVTYTRNADYSFTRTGTATEALGNVWMAGGYLVKPKADLSNVFCVLLKGVKYSIKDCVLLTVSPAGNALVARNENFVPTQDMYITGVRNENFIVGETYNDIVYPAVYVGEKALQYEPYREQLLTIPTPNGLPGIPVTSGGNYTDENGQQWICDEVDLERGVKVQRVGTYKFYSSDGFRMDQVAPGLTRFYIVIGDTLSADTGTLTSSALCSALQLGARGDTYGRINVFTIVGTRLYINIENITSVNELQQYLQQTPMTLIALLATPIETPLSETDIAAFRALTTYKGTTILESECYLKVKYSKLRK